VGTESNGSSGKESGLPRELTSAETAFIFREDNEETDMNKTTQEV
jgi:hypothetical protein